MSFISSQAKDMDLCHIKGIKDTLYTRGRKGEAIILCNHLNSGMSAASDLIIETQIIFCYVKDNRVSPFH